MSNNDVQLWFAKDKNNKITTINEVDKENKHDTYVCPLCGSAVIPRQGKEMAWHFAHRDKSKCSSESMYHWWFKNKFLEKGDKFIINADDKKEYIVESIEVEKEINIEGKIYKPDVTVITTTGAMIYFEMNYSNKKKIEDYSDIWIALQNTVLEIDVKTLMNQSINIIKEFKALWYDGKFLNIKSSDKEYYNTIGKYKEQIIKNDKYDVYKEDISKLDWFWRDIQEYKLGNKNIEYISDLIQSIEKEESKNIIVNMLRKSKCNYIIQDYLNYEKIIIKKIVEKYINKFNKDLKINLTYNIKYPNKIFDRIYDGIILNILPYNFTITIENYKKTNKIIDLLDSEYWYEKEKYIFNLKLSKVKHQWDYKSVCKNIDNLQYSIEFDLNKQTKEVECNRTSCVKFDINDINNYYKILINNGFLSLEDCIQLDKITFHIRKYFKNYLLSDWTIYTTISPFNIYNIVLSTKHNTYGWCHREYVQISLDIKTMKLKINYGDSKNINTFEEIRNIIIDKFNNVLTRYKFINDENFKFILDIKDKMAISYMTYDNYKIKRHEVIFKYYENIFLIIRGKDIYFNIKNCKDKKIINITKQILDKLNYNNDNNELEEFMCYINQKYYTLNKDLRVLLTNNLLELIECDNYNNDTKILEKYYINNLNDFKNVKNKIVDKFSNKIREIKYGIN